MDRDLTTSIRLIHQRLSKLETSLIQNKRKSTIYTGKSLQSGVKSLQGHHGDEQGLDEDFVADVKDFAKMLQNHTREQFKYEYISDTFEKFKRHRFTLSKAERAYLKHILFQVYFMFPRHDYDYMVRQAFKLYYPAKEVGEIDSDDDEEEEEGYDSRCK